MFCGVFGIFGMHVALQLHAHNWLLKWITIAHNNTNQNTSHFYVILGPQNSLFLKKLEIEEFFIVNSIPKEKLAQKKGSTSRCRNAKTKTGLESG